MNITHLSTQFQQNNNNANVLLLQVGAEYVNYVVNIVFKTPLGVTLFSDPITLGTDGNAEFEIPAAALDGPGCLQAQIVVSNSTGDKLIHSEKYIFNVFSSIEGERLSDSDKIYSVGDLLQKVNNIPTLPDTSVEQAGYVPTVKDDGKGYELQPSGGGNDVVRYSAQTKTDSEKSIARQNIGAADSNDIAEAVEGLASESYVDNAINTLDESLSDVAKSGSYNDLSDTPTIPSVEGLASEDYVDDAISSLDGSLSTVAKSGSYNDLANKPTIPSISGLASETYVDNAVNGLDAELSAVAKSGDYNDLSNVPTALSDFENDEDFATRDFVNSSISTNTANFKGTFDVVNDLGLTSAATHEMVAAALADAISSETNNDYAFVFFTNSTTGLIDRYDRYKYRANENAPAWEYEYTLNNSSFTANQWAAINSMATAAKISQIATNAADISSLGTSKQNVATKISQVAPSAITLADNTEYRLTNVADLTLTYPTGDFESWIRITTAVSGSVTITIDPSAQYIGSEPDFANGETWEISIKDGVVVAQKVGA